MNRKEKKEKKFRQVIIGIMVAVVLIVAVLVLIISFIHPDNDRAEQFGKSSESLLYNQADFYGMKRKDLKDIVDQGGDIPIEEQSEILKQNIKNAQARLDVYRNEGQKADRKAYSQLKTAPSARSLKDYDILYNYAYSTGHAAPVVVPEVGSFRDRGKYTTFMGKVYTGVSISAKAAEKLKAGDRLRLPVGAGGKRKTFHVDHDLVLRADDTKFQNSYLKKMADGRYYLFLENGSRYNVYYDKIRFYVLRGAKIGTVSNLQDVDATVLNSAKSLGNYNSVIFDRKGYVTGIYNFKD